MTLDIEGMLAISKGRVCVVEHTVNDMTLYSVVSLQRHVLYYVQ